ncbi:MAG TPA: hypothetical protein VIU38_01555 [Anaerolineales bacterium]
MHEQEPEQERVPDWVARIIGLDESPPGVGGPNVDARDSTAEQGAYVPPFIESPASPTGTDDLFWEADAPTADVDRLDRRLQGGTSSTEDSEVHEWLRKLDATASGAEERPSQRPIPAITDVPTWVTQMRGVTGDLAGPLPGGEAELPAWLQDSAALEAGETRARSTPSGEIPAETAPEPPLISTPDLGSKPPEVASPAAPQPTPPSVPAFSTESLDAFDVDAVFESMHMPDWLADVPQPEQPPEQAPPSEVPSEPAEESPMVPVDLPSWVEAMRPAAREKSGPAENREEGRLEQVGPLLGLQGVLPAVPAVTRPLNKPRPHAMRLEATEQHDTHARLLEEMLAAETRPLAITAGRALGPQRVLRWALGAILGLTLSAALVGKGTIFPFPSTVPIESMAAVRGVEGVPPDAHVLLVFDYEPATVGEMEATAASLIDHLLLLKHPRLALISTSPTGSLLAEGFMSTAVAARGYVAGTQYVNLGYLAGGLTGVRSFAGDPTQSLSAASVLGRAWDAGVLPGTERLSDFAAIIVLTDSLESGRVWIEQTAAPRGSTPLILVASSQAGPMLLPYFESGQVTGIVAGLNGAAGPEIMNSGLPGYVRRYWDGYNIGLYMGFLAILTAGAWRAWRLYSERRPEEI